MRLIRMLGITMIAAVAFAALIGTDSAMAEPELEEVVWCKQHEIPCQAGNVFPEATVAHAKSTNTEFLTNLGNVTCGSSAMTLTNGNTKLVHGEVTSLTFITCALGKTSCTVEALHLAWLYKGELQANHKDYEILMTEKGTNGEPQLKVKCGTLVNCTFGATTMLFTALLSLPLEELDVFQSLNRSGGICPAIAAWQAKYTAECLEGAILKECWIKMEEMKE